MFLTVLEAVNNILSIPVIIITFVIYVFLYKMVKKKKFVILLRSKKYLFFYMSLTKVFVLFLGIIFLTISMSVLLSGINESNTNRGILENGITLTTEERASLVNDLGNEGLFYYRLYNFIDYTNIVVTPLFLGALLFMIMISSFRNDKYFYLISYFPLLLIVFGLFDTIFISYILNYTPIHSSHYEMLEVIQVLTVIKHIFLVLSKILLVLFSGIGIIKVLREHINKYREDNSSRVLS